MVHSPSFPRSLCSLCPPCSPCSPWSPYSLFHFLGTLLAVTGSVHLGLRLLVNWTPHFPVLCSLAPYSNISIPPRLLTSKCTPISTVSRNRLSWSGTLTFNIISIRRFVPFDVLFFWHFYHSTFCHSAFCPIRRFVLRRFLLSAFFTLTFCRWTLEEYVQYKAVSLDRNPESHAHSFPLSRILHSQQKAQKVNQKPIVCTRCSLVFLALHSQQQAEWPRRFVLAA